MVPIGLEQLEQARAPPRGLVRRAGGSGRRRASERGAGATGRAGVEGVGRRIGFSFTVPSERVPPFYV